MNTGQNPTKDFQHNQWIDNIFNQLAVFREFLIEAGRAGFTLSKMALSRINREIGFFIKRLTAWDFVCGGLSMLVMTAGGLLLLFGFSLIGYQTFLWLKDGVWTEFPIIMVFNFIFENTWLQGWLTQPESWYGLQKVVLWTLDNVPLSLALIVPGLVTVLVSGGVISAALVIRFYQFKQTEQSHDTLK